MAGGGAEGAGRRRALVRARAAEDDRAVRRLPRHAQPGLRRRERRRRRPPTAAVDATAGQVLTYGGKIATTYFFSTSGGRTAASSRRLEVRAGSVPRLRRRPVRHDLAVPRLGADALHARRKLASALKVAGKLLDVQTTVDGVAARRHAARDRRQAASDDCTGTDVRTMLGLRSTWFRSACSRSIRCRRRRSPYGTPFTLTGLGRGLGDLRARAAGGRDDGVGAEPRGRAGRRRLVLASPSRRPRRPSTASTAESADDAFDERRRRAAARR